MTLMDMRAYAVLSISLFRMWETRWKELCLLFTLVALATLLTQSIIVLFIGLILFWIIQFVYVVTTSVPEEEINRYLQ